MQAELSSTAVVTSSVLKRPRTQHVDSDDDDIDVPLHVLDRMLAQATSKAARSDCVAVSASPVSPAHATPLAVTTPEYHLPHVLSGTTTPALDSAPRRKAKLGEALKSADGEMFFLVWPGCPFDCES